MPRTSDHNEPKAQRDAADERPPRVVTQASAVALALLASTLLIISVMREDQREALTVTTLRIDLNEADEHELRLLPGIGPALAERIVAERDTRGPFRSLDELERVSGIGPRTVDAVAPYVQQQDTGEPPP